MNGWFGKGSSVRLVIPLRLSFLFPLAAVLPLSSILRTPSPLTRTTPLASDTIFLSVSLVSTFARTHSLIHLFSFSAPGSEWNSRYSLPVLVYPLLCLVLCARFLFLLFRPSLSLCLCYAISPDLDPDPDHWPPSSSSSSCSCVCACSSNVVLSLSTPLGPPISGPLFASTKNFCPVRS